MVEYATDKGMFDCGNETDFQIVPTTSTPNEASYPVDSQLTPSSKRKKATKSKKPSDADTCRKCGIKFFSAEDKQYNSRSIGCDVGSCNYWVHLKCLNFFVAVNRVEEFERSVKFFCDVHKPRSSSVV